MLHKFDSIYLAIFNVSMDISPSVCIKSNVFESSGNKCQPGHVYLLLAYIIAAATSF